MGEVIKLNNDTVLVAQCPECECTDWWLLVDDEPDHFNFRGVMCCECGYEIDLTGEEGE